MGNIFGSNGSYEISKSENRSSGVGWTQSVEDRSCDNSIILVSYLSYPESRRSVEHDDIRPTSRCLLLILQSVGLLAIGGLFECRNYWNFTHHIHTLTGTSDVPATAAGVDNDSDPGREAVNSKQKLNPDDFILSEKQKEVLVREPGSIGGQQFIVEECRDCDIYLLDHTAALTIDVCIDCRILTGPCESSVFIRNCKNCTVVLACQQFRARYCSGCTFFLFSATTPVVESSTDLRFACYTLDYFSLAGQFTAANLSVWNNKWSQVFNFTGRETDWSCLPFGSHHRDYTANRLPEAARQRAGYTEGTNGAVVPLTVGVRGFKPEEETCFVVVMPAHIDTVLGKLLAVGSGGAPLSPGRPCRLLRTKLFRPQKAQSKTFFEGAPATLINLAASAPVLGMQWAGGGSKETAMSLLTTAGVVTSNAALTTGNNGGGASGGGSSNCDILVNGQFFMMNGPEACAAKAEVFFEQWGEDKGTSSMLCG